MLCRFFVHPQNVRRSTRNANKFAKNVDPISGAGYAHLFVCIYCRLMSTLFKEPQPNSPCPLLAHKSTSANMRHRATGVRLMFILDGVRERPRITNLYRSIYFRNVQRDIL